MARIEPEELRALLEGYGYAPRFVEGSDPEEMHQLMAATLDDVLDEIAGIQPRAREDHYTARPRWPMIVLRSPKGWTGPKEVDGSGHGRRPAWLRARVTGTRGRRAT